LGEEEGTEEERLIDGGRGHGERWEKRGERVQD
jgi:hypothetical protein